MKTINLDEMSIYAGGAKGACSKLGTIGDVMTVVGFGLGMVALVATGPIGLIAGGLVSSMSLAGVGLGAGYLIAC